MHEMLNVPITTETPTLAPTLTPEVSVTSIEGYTITPIETGQPVITSTPNQEVTVTNTMTITPTTHTGGTQDPTSSATITLTPFQTSTVQVSPTSTIQASQTPAPFTPPVFITQPGPTQTTPVIPTPPATGTSQFEQGSNKNVSNPSFLDQLMRHLSSNLTIIY